MSRSRPNPVTSASGDSGDGGEVSLLYNVANVSGSYQAKCGVLP